MGDFGPSDEEMNVLLQEWEKTGKAPNVRNVTKYLWRKRFETELADKECECLKKAIKMGYSDIEDIKPEIWTNYMSMNGWSLDDSDGCWTKGKLSIKIPDSYYTLWGVLMILAYDKKQDHRLILADMLFLYR